MKVLFQRGLIPLTVLALLKREDMYGYQIVQEIKATSEGALISQEGVVYPVLYKLAEQGLISERIERTGKRQVRNYYHLEPAGEKHLAELAKEFEATTRGVFRILGHEI